MIPELPPGRVQVPASYRSEIKRRDAKLDELARSGVVDTFAAAMNRWARYKAADGVLPTNSVATVQQWSLADGNGSGITLGTESGGLPNALFTLPAGLWDVKISWLLTGGGFDRAQDRCDYWLATDEGSTYFGDVMAPGYYTASTTASGDILAEAGTTVKMHFYSTFAWSLNDLTISFEKKG